MLTRTAPTDLSRTLEAKSVRRPWNPSLHPRDSKGRFIETGGIARLWSGNLARVVRALPRDRVLVQDRAADGTYSGRRHSTSARWITMVARPDGTAPTANQEKVEEEDARRSSDDRRGLGLSRDDHGAPETPDDPHDVDDEGNQIGDDEGDAPEDDDQDEPEDGSHDVDTDALPNRQALPGSRFKDTAAVRRHFLDMSEQPGANARALRRLAGDEDLQITPDGGLVTTRDDANGRWYLTATSTGGYLPVGDFASRNEADAAADFIHAHVRNGHIAPGDFNQPIDFSDPKIGTWLPGWRSTKGEDAEQAILRAARDFRASRTKNETPRRPAAPSPAPEDRTNHGVLAPDGGRPVRSPAGDKPKPDAAPEPEDTPEENSSGRPAGVPAEATPVDGVPGYWATSWNPGPLTVYGPDGSRIASVEGGYSDRHAMVDGVRLPIGGHAGIADQIIARHHLATTDPAQADRVHLAWTIHKTKRVVAVRGTAKDNTADDRAVNAAGKLAWSPVQSARITGTQWKPETRDRKAADILAAFVRQGRNVRVTDETTSSTNSSAASKPPLDEEAKRLRAASEADLRGSRDNLQIHVQTARTPRGKQQALNSLRRVEAELERRRTTAADGERKSPQERAAALNDVDLTFAIRDSENERGTYGSRQGDRLTEDEQALYADRRRRSTERIAEASAPQDLDDVALAARVQDLQRMERTHNPSGSSMHEEDDLAPERDMWTEVLARLADAETEQQTRQLREIEQRPPVQDLTDEELEAERINLPARLRRLSAEQNKAVEARRATLRAEREKRKADVYLGRREPAQLDDSELIAEFSELDKAHRMVSGREREAIDERRQAVFDEQNRRGAAGREEALARTETREDPLRASYSIPVQVDGNSYGEISYHAVAGPYGRGAGWNAQTGRAGRGLGAYPSMAEALAAVVDSYDSDPETEPVRLYGQARQVWVPKMFYELYQSSRRADSFPSASKERQTLADLFKRSYYGWSDRTNPITGKIGKGAILQVPEGLLAEFQRVTEDLSREMMLRANDRELDSSDRSRARTRLAAINAALHGIDAERTRVRKDGGDDDRKVISREEIEAQQAALRAALNTDKGAEGEHLQPGGQGPLGEVPAQGAGADDRSGEVLPGQGQGDRDGDSGGRGGAGEDRAGGGGVRAEGGSAQADQGERDGDGAAGPAARARAGDRGDAGADAGDAGSAGDEGRGLRHVGRFRPDPADAAARGPLQRAAANIEAIRVLKRLEQEKRPATDEEKRVLARWSGWGSVPVLFAAEPNEKEPRYQQGGARYGKFEQDHARWAEYAALRAQLSGELTGLEWQQARRGTMSMHYTPQAVAEAMWDGLKALGFERGDVLEAGSGSGTFFGVSPQDAHLTGVELDPTTARIARAIYPDVNVLNENFAETDAPAGTFDAAIGNVPFAAVPFGDKRYPSESLHNGFVTKELALTRPGGITLLITSRHTLDSKGDKARQRIAEYGDLIGAVRLPSGVFTDAGTGVVADVLVLRRRADGQEPADTSWLNAPERKVGSSREHVNAYFTQHPEHILGDLTTESSPYGPRLTVKGNPNQAADRLRDALRDIAEKAKADGRAYEPHPDGHDRAPVHLQTAREKHANDWTGRLYDGDDGRLYQHVNGGDPVAVEPADGRADQLRALMKLRDVAAELRVLDRKQEEDKRAEKLRARLRDLHTAYVQQYGPLSKPGQFRSMKTGVREDGTEERTPTAWGYFRSDPDAGSVLALERWDADKQEPVLSRVFTERAAARRQPLDQTDDPKTALSAVVAATGRVDLDEIARLLNTDPQEALRALGTEVFTDPATGRLELAGAYLSGPVRDKLADARRAAERDPAFQVNVAALEAVQPVDRTIGEFTPEMGAHWTPPELLEGFLREYLGDKTLRVAHDDRFGWLLYTGQVPKANNILHGVAANEEKGTKGKDAVGIVRAILGHGSLTVYRDDKRRDVDEETSRLVRQKADQMRSEFAKYATANADRLTRLTDSYNTIMNGHVVRSYDGMSPSLDGFTPDREPHPWQLSGAARMQFERSVILAHEVGLGKTSTLVMGTQALKGSGQVEKPFAVVPDHLAQQWYDEARYLYPNADIHLITSADLADGRRDSTLEWLRANKPDLVIFTEPAFGSIKMSPEAQEAYEFRELEALREQLDRQYADADNPAHPFIVAKIEQRIATVQNKISKNAAPMRTPGATYWDDLGFDYAVVDEAHRYKGVGFRSREGGGDPASIRGVDLHQKLTDLHRRRAGRATVTLATGTPLSNSITEQYTMLALSAPWVLDSYKAGAPDLWAATFGRKTLRIENAPDGSGLRVVERFSEFYNRRAMKTMWGLVADTKRAEDVGIPRPKIKGGQPNLVMVESTKDQTARLKKLMARGRAIHNGDVHRSQDNMLAVSNEGTSVALDPRLVDAKAPAGKKLAAVAARHIERYHQHKDRVYKTHYGSAEDHPVPGALQMIFLNEGVPGGNNRGNFDAYAELKRLMVQGGIPENKIAFVQDSKKSGKPEHLAELFRRARDGDVSVLIGSSSVAGTGMNAQNRMVSLTHVDLDWGAAQMEQRNGRILRYGNQNDEVEVDIFATKGSLDGWKAGFVASKAEGLIDIQRPEMADSDTRDTVTELDVDYPDYETMEAEIGGNPYMSQLMKARRQLRDLEIDQHNEAAERVRRADTLAELTQESADTRDGIARREAALPRIRDVRADFTMTLGGLPYAERADAAAALHRQVTTQLLDHTHDGASPWKTIGQFGGLDVAVRTERRADGKLIAHVGFPDLARSSYERTPDDLKKRGAGSGMITRLANALEKAPALQEADRQRLPELDEQIALLQSAQSAADLTPQIEHARTRANLLDDIVGRIADLDKLPEIDEDDLDTKLPQSERRKIIAERQTARVPLEGAVGEAVEALEEFDRKFPEPERPERPRDREQEHEPVRLPAAEVAQVLDAIRTDDDETGEEPANAESSAENDDSSRGGESPQPLIEDAVEPSDSAPDNTLRPDEPTSPHQDPQPVPDAPEANPTGSDDTVTLDRDDVEQQLDAIRPTANRAPSSMSEQEIADEIVSLMEREMMEGELTGADRTRMAVLEAENDRRAGRTPKPEPKKPAPDPTNEGGLFDVTEPAPRATPAADPGNPLDQPDDLFGTPDMFADHEGRNTSRLRPAQMRSPEDLAEGDRYTDADGRTHTVAEPPKRTGRGRVRIVTGDGKEHFYNRDAEVRLRYPDEEIDDVRDRGLDDRDTSDGLPDDADKVAAPDDDERDQDDQRRRDRHDGETDGATPDGSPSGGAEGLSQPDIDHHDGDGDGDGENNTAPGRENREKRDENEDRRRRRRRKGSGSGVQGPNGPGLPGLPGLPHLPDADAGIPGGGDAVPGEGGAAAARSSRPRGHRDMQSLRTSWRRGDGLSAEENTPERQAFLVRLADNPTVSLSSGGGLVTWTDDDAPDGMRRWQFAQARAGGRLGRITLTARTSEEARDLANLFEIVTGADGQPIDWHQPLTQSIVDGWRDRDGRTLPAALRHLRDLYQDGDEKEAEPDKPLITLPEDLSDWLDEDLADAWGAGLSPADQERVVAEMDRRDDTDQRVRDALPQTPAADADEVRRRGEAMDTALKFADADVTRRPLTREERTRQEFADWDEARYQAALTATNGYFFKRDSRHRPPVSERELFSGGSLSRFGRWRDYASEELIDWYDAHGGRVTYNTFKAQRRTQERVEREQYEAQQHGAAPSPDAPSAPTGPSPSGTVSDTASRTDTADDPTNTDTRTRTDLDLDSIPLASAAAGHESEQEGTARFGGPEQVRAFVERAQVRSSGERTFDVWMDGRRIGHVRHVGGPNEKRSAWDSSPTLTLGNGGITRAASRDLAVAALVVRDLRTPVSATDPDKDTWSTVRMHLAGHYPELPELHPRLAKDPAVRDRYEQIVQLVARLRDSELISGDLRQDIDHAKGEFEWLRDVLSTLPAKQQDHDTLKDLERRSFWASLIREGLPPEARSERGHTPVGHEGPGASPNDVAGDEVSGAAASADASRSTGSEVHPPTGGTSESRLQRDPQVDPGAARENRDEDARARQVRQPEDRTGSTNGEPVAAPGSMTNETENSVTRPEASAEPEPVGGQPAHWASIEQLAPGDMARVDGTARTGRTTTLSGFVLDYPERVAVTHRGRTAEMWRITIGESPDGQSGTRGSVYTPLTATAARAEAPETSVPGAPVSGAQSEVASGELPDRIATDSTGSGLFPGSHVTAGDGRDGTVTGVTDSTVNVRWSDGDSDTGIAPASLTADDASSHRPAGWTSSGQRIRPGHVVADDGGALLGPVDETTGDRITVTTTSGPAIHDASRLRVVGEVRDETPDDAPVAALTQHTAGDAAKGDILVLDLDGALSTVEVQDTDRDGDRVTLDYIDITTGEVGTIEMDAATVVPKAEGPSGGTPALSRGSAPTATSDITVHEPPAVLDPVTGPTVDPDLTPADRAAIANQGSAPEDDPDVQQAVARIGADLPVTPGQATALAARLRATGNPATRDGRAALRAAGHLDPSQAPAGLDRPRPSTAAQVGEGDIIAMPDVRRDNEVHTYRILDVEEAPGGMRNLLLEDENRQWKRRIVPADMPLWQLPEPARTEDDSTPPATPTEEPARRDPNLPPSSARRQIIAEHGRTMTLRIIDEAVAGTEPTGNIHALREQIAGRLTPDALRETRERTRREANAALDAAGFTGRDRASAQQALRRTRESTHEQTVRAALRTINDLEPLPGESDEDLAQRAAALLRLIPTPGDSTHDRSRRSPSVPGARTRSQDSASTEATDHVEEAAASVLRHLQDGLADPSDLDALAGIMTRQLDGSRRAAAQRIVRRAAPGGGRQPGLLARAVDLLRRLGRRLVDLVKAAARKIAELWRSSRDRASRMRAFLHRLVRRVRDWPESRRLARLHEALDLPDVDGDTLAARVFQWTNLLPAPGQFGQRERSTAWWKPTTWAQLAAGRLPGRTTGRRFEPDRAPDHGPGPTALRHLAVVRAAGADVDRDVTRRLSALLGDDFGDDPHGTLQTADDYLTSAEHRLLNLQAARATAPNPDVEVEITAARLEAASARREWEDLRRQYAAAIPDAVAGALAGIRDLGPQGSAGFVFGPDTAPDAERAVRAVQRLLPRDWLTTPDVRRLTATSGDAGRYEPGVNRATVADLGDAGTGTAAHALGQHLPTHLPDLEAAQSMYWFTRTHTGRPGARVRDSSGLGRLLAQQQTQRATGDTLARSMQALFIGDWYLDDDLRAFLLGLLATR
ncbi:hypothetical protein AB0C52_13060 [Streptomyces sp. NPDC048717]|uniref:hypothetical protein n=1 Tax=Streptomyces sp. NPDC048717 TaxID=3154928 RepID=UPI00344089AC